MKNGNENENMILLDSKEMRESVIEQVGVLDKVGELLLLPNSEYSTTDQIAIYYKVDKATVRQVITRNRDELSEDGITTLKGKEIKEKYNVCDTMSQTSNPINVQNVQGGILIGDTKVAYASNTLFPKRAILRIGMLLRDSEVAREVRTRLLDITHDAEQGKTEIIQNVVEEISEEKQLIFDRVEAEISGDWDKVWETNAKMFALKNKRIKELEVLNKQITTHSLTITESRDVVNRIVRTIAMVKYRSMFGQAWNELYTKVNYKLGINIRSRDKKKGESYIGSLNESELFKVEEIVRNWAVECGLDLDKLLKIA